MPARNLVTDAGGDDSAVSDDVAVADDDGAGFHDQHQNDAESAEVAPL